MEKSDYQKALDIINRCHNQTEAIELLKSELGGNAYFDVKFLYAFYDLPAGDKFSQYKWINKKQGWKIQSI